MTKKRRLIRKLLERPESLRYGEIEKILIWIGFEKIEAKGSHVKFNYKDLGINFSIPVHRTDCKTCYKKFISKILKDSFYD